MALKVRSSPSVSLEGSETCCQFHSHKLEETSRLNGTYHKQDEHSDSCSEDVSEANTLQRKAKKEKALSYHEIAQTLTVRYMWWYWTQVTQPAILQK